MEWGGTLTTRRCETGAAETLGNVILHATQQEGAAGIEAVCTYGNSNIDLRIHNDVTIKAAPTSHDMVHAIHATAHQ